MQRSTDAPESLVGDGNRVAAGTAVAVAVGGQCWQFLQPLLRELDTRLDVRLVRTLAATSC